MCADFSQGIAKATVSQELMKKFFGPSPAQVLYTLEVHWLY
jgi:hypothetical protein